MNRLDQGVLAAKGFRVAAVSCGLKSKPGALDMGLIVSDSPATPAGCYTKNRVCSAAVQWSRSVTRRKRARAILVNSGNANACTGEQGLQDARECARRAATAIGVQAEEVAIASTGVIGHPLPMHKMRSGIDAATASLGTGEDRDLDLAKAIMTTDTVPKRAAVRVELPGGSVHIGAVAKGAGMISPRMGTMLSFIATDAAVSSPLLRQTVRDVVNRTYNRLTVDGDTSTNDTVALLANGASGAHPIDESGKALEAFAQGLETVTRALVEMLARDGEGATRLIIVTVRKARNERHADTVARAIANSPLVKCAVYGGDPNWGRIVCAAGYSGAPVQPERMKLRIGGVLAFADGVPVGAPTAELEAAMAGDEVAIDLDLGQGEAEATMWTCDFSKEYVAVNADYHT